LFKPVIVIGGGGHAAVLVDMLRQINQPILAIVCPVIDSSRQVLLGIKHLLEDEDILAYDCKEVELVNGIGSLPGNSLRFEIFKHFKTLGYTFKTLVSPYAIVSPYAQLGEGVQVMPNAVIQSGVVVGEGSIINTAAAVEHDSKIGAHNHIAPGAVICGDVTTGKAVHVGAGATVIQSLFIGEKTVVGAGACLTKDTEAKSTVYPARVVVKNKNGYFK